MNTDSEESAEIYRATLNIVELGQEVGAPGPCCSQPQSLAWRGYQNGTLLSTASRFGMGQTKSPLWLGLHVV